MSPAESVRAFIALGSNLGDRRANLEGAVDALRSADGIAVLATSPWIETRAEGGPPGQPDFLNGCVEAETSVSAEDLLWLLLRIESQFGRDRKREARHGPRTLDLDLLLYGEQEIQGPGLIVPHPRLEERRFVLEPLCSLAPERRLPRSGRTVRERLAELVRRAEPRP